MSAIAIVGLAAVVAVAGFAQGATGIGFALIVAPVMGYLWPELVPTTVLALMIPLNFYVAWRERGSIDRPGATWVTIGRVAGTFGGLWILAALPLSAINLLIGWSTVVAVLGSLAAPAFAPGRVAFASAGLVTGITETATGVGGPPLALVYQHHGAQAVRSTIATCFLLGELLSLVFLASVDRIHPVQVKMALLLLPAMAIGAWASEHVHHRVDAKLLRYIVLWFSLVSGIVLIMK